MHLKRLLTAAALALAVIAVPLTGAHAASGHTGSRENQAFNGRFAGGAYYDRQWHGRIIIRGGHVWWNGHRGWHHKRHGYRYYRGYWFPAAAFAITVAPRPVYRPVPQVTHLPALHVAWCQGRYKTYRVHDNTYAWKAGHRTWCRSPYWR